MPTPPAFAIIPVKPLARAKSRLARALKAPTRAALVRSLFSRTLDVIAQTPRIDGVIVVSRDLTILELTRQRNLIALMESDSGLNPAITQAAQRALAHHAHSVIVIPVDLPLITAADLDVVIGALLFQGVEAARATRSRRRRGLAPTDHRPGSMHRSRRKNSRWQDLSRETRTNHN